AGEPEESPSDGMFDRPATSRLGSIWEDGDGFLWLIMIVPSSQWEPGPPEREAAGLDERAILALRDRPRVETIIEAVDLENRSVLARSRFNGPIGVRFGGGYLAESFDDLAGEPGLLISRMHLQNRTEEPNNEKN
ncbi:MAG: hypothetical protein ACREQV_21815, partial [Candidatus Binatia bacterium]